MAPVVYFGLVALSHPDSLPEVGFPLPEEKVLSPRP